MLHLIPMPHLLAQSTSVTETLSGLVQALATPNGILAATIFILLMAFVVLHRNGAYVGGAIVLLTMTMMTNESKYFDNTLFGPLQRVRDVSRPLAFALLFAMSVNLLLAPAGRRRRTFTFGMAAFFLFETYFLIRLGLHGETLRASLGWVTDLLILVAFAWGFGKKLEDDEGFEKYVNMFGIASIGFILLNMVQLSLGYAQAIAGSRFAGISGNPQLAGYVSAIFILFNAHIFSRSRFGSASRWVYGISIGVLGILVLWSGSRTSALAAAVGLVAYFRFRLGSATLLAAVGGISLAFAASIFGESLLGIDRFIYGENTRRGVWLSLLDDFYSAPIFGTIDNRVGETVSGQESSYLTTMALMGISGLIPLMVSVISIAALGGKLLLLRRRGNVRPLQSDVVFASVLIIIVGSIFEGFFLGILSLPVIFIYSTLALGAYLVERDAEPPPPEEDGGGDEWELEGDEDAEDDASEAYVDDESSSPAAAGSPQRAE